jgi:hypothetical protein
MKYHASAAMMLKIAMAMADSIRQPRQLKLFRGAGGLARFTAQTREGGLSGGSSDLLISVPGHRGQGQFDVLRQLAGEVCCLEQIQ